MNLKIGWFSELYVQIATFHPKVPSLELSEFSTVLPFRMGAEMQV